MKRMYIPHERENPNEWASFDAFSQNEGLKELREFIKQRQGQIVYLPAKQAGLIKLLLSKDFIVDIEKVHEENVMGYKIILYINELEYLVTRGKTPTEVFHVSLDWKNQEFIIIEKIFER